MQYRLLIYSFCCLKVDELKAIANNPDPFIKEVLPKLVQPKLREWATKLTDLGVPNPDTAVQFLLKDVDTVCIFARGRATAVVSPCDRC